MLTVTRQMNHSYKVDRTKALCFHPHKFLSFKFISAQSSVRLPILWRIAQKFDTLLTAKNVMILDTLVGLLRDSPVRTI